MYGPLNIILKKTFKKLQRCSCVNIRFSDVVLSLKFEHEMSWVRILASMFPQATAVIVRVAPYLLIPVIVPVGFIGYKIESRYRIAEQGRPSIADLREIRQQNERDDPNKESNRKPRTIFERNAPETERGVLNRVETMND